MRWPKILLTGITVASASLLPLSAAHGAFPTFTGYGDATSRTTTGELDITSFPLAGKTMEFQTVSADEIRATVEQLDSATTTLLGAAEGLGISSTTTIKPQSCADLFQEPHASDVDTSTLPEQILTSQVYLDDETSLQIIVADDPKSAITTKSQQNMQQLLHSCPDFDIQEELSIFGSSMTAITHTRIEEFPYNIGASEQHGLQATAIGELYEAGEQTDSSDSTSDDTNAGGYVYLSARVDNVAVIVLYLIPAIDSSYDEEQERVTDAYLAVEALEKVVRILEGKPVNTETSDSIGDY